MRAPVAGSGCAPACTASVSKPYSAMRVPLGAPERPADAEGGGFAVVDGAPVHAVPADLAGEPAIFDLGTAIHDDREPGGLGARRGVFVDHAELHPQHLHAQAILVGEHF